MYLFLYFLCNVCMYWIHYEYHINVLKWKTSETPYEMLLDCHISWGDIFKVLTGNKPVGWWRTCLGLYSLISLSFVLIVIFTALKTLSYLIYSSKNLNAINLKAPVLTLFMFCHIFSIRCVLKMFLKFSITQRESWKIQITIFIPIAAHAPIMLVPHDNYR